ncbi:hypothetical protein ACVMB3_004215 [Sinorhizobium meliloti]
MAHGRQQSQRCFADMHEREGHAEVRFRSFRKIDSMV